ncbi:MAG: aminotransferase class I/II-fold pyridoxal phosphate-dependent enzyme [Phycisphaerales bacterium]
MIATSQVSDRLRDFGSTVFAEMTAMAVRHEAINLSQGFPDFDGPAAMLEALGRAAGDGLNQYAPLSGVPELRQGAAKWFQEFGGIEVDPVDWVTATCGCTEAIAATMLGLLNPGDGLVVFQPCYDSYQATASMAGARLIPVTLSPDERGESSCSKERPSERRSRPRREPSCSTRRTTPRGRCSREPSSS